jgi:hypothetical protein
MSLHLTGHARATAYAYPGDTEQLYHLTGIQTPGEGIVIIPPFRGIPTV